MQVLKTQYISIAFLLILSTNPVQTGFCTLWGSWAEENICLVLFRRQNGISGPCDYISFPKMIGSSAYFEVYTVRNAQIWLFSKGFKNLPSWPLYIHNSIVLLDKGNELSSCNIFRTLTHKNNLTSELKTVCFASLKTPFCWWVRLLQGSSCLSQGWAYTTRT